MQEFTFIDLFCGAGGLAQGFKDAGFKSVWAVDSESCCGVTYEKNFHHKVHVGDIRLVRSPLPKADIIIGGPPCQGFSPLGKMIPTSEHTRMNELWKEFLRFVREVRPKAFVVENVPEFLKSVQCASFVKQVEKLGYHTNLNVLKAVEFGVPQKRRRGFILGALSARPEFPSPSEIRRTVRDAIGDLPRIPDGENWHIGRNPTVKSIQRYKCIPPGGNRFDLMKKRPDLTPDCWLRKKSGSTDVFGRLRWDEPALTIRTEFYKPEKGRYLHPEAHRPITHREAARLQTFPDDFQFVGTLTETARMIGNAVPPLLAHKVANSVREVLSRKRLSKVG